ncbi:MAG: hypothetical protein ABR925_01285 [Acidimicrobiales bacterium]|jgi:hypothetical protein
MASWRESASPQAQDDLGLLLSSVIPFAMHMLVCQGELFPFGASVRLNGESRLIGGDPGSDERPWHTDVVEHLVEVFRSTRNDLRATAIVSALDSSDANALRVDLEHSEGLAMQVVLPYVRKRRGLGLEYRPPEASIGRRVVWPDCSGRPDPAIPGA